MDNIEEIKRSKEIANDRLRYHNNTLSSVFCYLAIILNVLYFISIYKTNNSFYSSYMIGLSVLTNLGILLSSFLASEGVKKYNNSYAIMMIVIGLIQLVRIFIFPVQAHKTEITENDKVIGLVMENKQFFYCIFCLIASSLSMFVGAAIGFVKTARLNKHLKTLEK